MVRGTLGAFVRTVSKFVSTKARSKWLTDFMSATETGFNRFFCTCGYKLVRT